MNNNYLLSGWKVGAFISFTFKSKKLGLNFNLSQSPIYFQAERFQSCFIGIVIHTKWNNFLDKLVLVIVIISDTYYVIQSIPLYKPLSICLWGYTYVRLLPLTKVFDINLCYTWPLWSQTKNDIEVLTFMGDFILFSSRILLHILLRKSLCFFRI